MSQLQNYADTIEKNGNTVLQNNQEQETIPVGSLVRLINTFNGEEDGLCLFVVNVGRDCDGEILYDLSFDINAQKNLDKHQQDFDNQIWMEEEPEEQYFVRISLMMKLFEARGSIKNGRVRSVLEVIKSSNT